MKMHALRFAVLAMSLAVAPAWASIVVNGNNADRTHDCGGDSAVVNGNRNQLKFRNCASLTVNGNDNAVDGGEVDTITVMGSGNRVTWSGDKPTIVNLGRNNSVGGGGGKGSSSKTSDGDATVSIDSGGVKVGGISVGSDGTISVGGESGSGTGAFVLSQDSQTLTHDCKGGDAQIRGDSNTLRLTDCRTVTLAGDNNTVRAAGVEAVKVVGDNNTVSWTADRAPKISNLGDGNVISRK
jgi:hypothetical protein